MIPVSLVYRRNRFHNKRASDTAAADNPLYVYGYGSYGYALPVGFSPTRLALLDRGVIVAYAHIRGGGELGDKWHDAGKMRVKMNTFTDFIAVVETLLREGYGSPERVAIDSKPVRARRPRSHPRQHSLHAADARNHSPLGKESRLLFDQRN